MSGKLIYRTFSLRRTITSTVFRIGALLVAFVAIWHVSENPLVTTVVFIGGLLFFLVAGDDEISIHEDELRISGGSLLRTLRGKSRYRFRDLATIQVNEIIDDRHAPITSIINALLAPRSGSHTPNKVTITLRDGKSSVRRLMLYRNEIDDALKKIPAGFSDLLKDR